jgi:glycosyltransferase involved in cell wall biosynthesis
VTVRSPVVDDAATPLSRLRVSVVVPCHNYGRYLGEAIASVDAQSRRPDEIVICDDGSTDDTPQVLRALCDGRDDIVHDRHETAHGMVRTFNELVARSTGELIVVLSADDRLGPRYIETVERAFVAGDLDFGYTDLQCFGAESVRHVVPELDPDLLVRSNYIAGASPFRRQVFERAGGYRPAFERIGHEDYDFWLSVVESGARGAKIHGCHYEWRRHAAGSRNTVGLGRRVLLRLALVRYHPRFFLHPRTVRAVRAELAARRTSPAAGDR